MAVEVRRIENFLYREARLADENEYDAWLSLWAEDACYWVPSNRDDVDPHQHISIIYDDRERLGHRIDRLKSGAAYSQDPPSRMRRLLSNIEVEELGDDEIMAYANFNLTELRRAKQDTFAGRTVYKLRPQNGDYKLVLKKVLLVNNDVMIDNLTFLI